MFKMTSYYYFLGCILSREEFDKLSIEFPPDCVHKIGTQDVIITGPKTIIKTNLSWNIDEKEKESGFIFREKIPLSVRKELSNTVCGKGIKIRKLMSAIGIKFEIHFCEITSSDIEGVEDYISQIFLVMGKRRIFSRNISQKDSEENIKEVSIPNGVPDNWDGISDPNKI